jgi:hypothetical protein
MVVMQAKGNKVTIKHITTVLTCVNDRLAAAMKSLYVDCLRRSTAKMHMVLRVHKALQVSKKVDGSGEVPSCRHGTVFFTLVVVTEH